MGGEAPLNPLSTDKEMELIEKTLTDVLGESTFDNEKYLEVDTQLKTDKANIYKKVKESTKLKTDKEVEEFLIKNAINWVADELLLSYFGYDEELIELTNKDFIEKGVYLRHFINGLKNAWAINTSIWNQEVYKSLGLIDRIKTVLNDTNFYNPLPLLGISAILIAVITSLVMLIFKSLQGMKGKKYPHAFISSGVSGALVILLLMLSSFITIEHYLIYHTTEYARLLNLLKFGQFSLPIYIALLTFATAVVVSVLGRFCRWGKKKED